MRISQQRTYHFPLPRLCANLQAVQSLSEVRPCIPAPTSLPPLPPAFTSLPLSPIPTESSSPSNPPATVSQQRQAISPDVSAASLQAEENFGTDTDTGSDLCRIDRGDLPVSISDMYVAAGAGEQLQRLQQLTRQDFTLLPAPNSGNLHMQVLPATIQASPAVFCCARTVAATPRSILCVIFFNASVLWTEWLEDTCTQHLICLVFLRWS